VRRFSFRNRKINGAIVGLVPSFLAVTLATFWAVLPARGAEAQLNRLSVALIEITGGSGANAWRIRYGAHYSFYQVQLVRAGPDRAWFSHGDWLRLIDTQRGIVIGRWRFPAQIVGLVPKEKRVQVEIEDRMGEERVFHRTVLLDPQSPDIPQWPLNNSMMYTLSLTEVSSAWSAVDLGSRAAGIKVTPQTAQQLIPQLEEAIRRDPLTPWLRVALGKTLWDIGDPRAKSEFQQAVQVPTTDFTELLNISALVETLGEQEVARVGFERGYKDFLARGNDPRLNFAYWVRNAIYDPRARSWGNPPLDHRSELVERIYRISRTPTTVCRLYADYLQKNGRPEEARVWRARAEETKRKFAFSLGQWFLGGADREILVVLGAIFAAFAYFIILFVRYLPQRRLDIAKRRQAVVPPPGSTVARFRTWSLGEQISFVALVAITWLIAYVRMPEQPFAFWSALFAFYLSFPIALLGFVVIYLRRWWQGRRAMPSPQSTVGPATYSWLDFRHWGLVKRMGFFAAVVAGGSLGYMSITAGEVPVFYAMAVIWSAIVGALIYLLVIYVLDWPRRRREEHAVKLAPGFSWFNMIYWSTRERIAFLLIALVGWFTVGIIGLEFRWTLRMVDLPWATGSYAGPVTQWHLQNSLPPTPERDLLLAVSYQQSGENEKAERLYKTLPNFAESWNNLGVILKAEDKGSDARQAFEHALQIDPALPEARLNLGQQPNSYWAQEFQKYLPGRPMLALPNPDVIRRAYWVASASQLYLSALAGPLSGEAKPDFDFATGEAPLGIILLLLVLAVAHVFLIPRQEVTQPPAKAVALWEALLPGTSPAWSIVGGLVLLGWSYFVLRAVLALSIGTPYFFDRDIMLNTAIAYGVPASESDVLRVFNPSWVWIYVAPAVLFLVNLLLVFSDKLFRKSV
jgi:tetratricopeptide (TPR) repeat protein